MVRKPRVNNTVTLDTKIPGTNEVIHATEGSKWNYRKTKKKFTTLVNRALIQQKCVPVNPYGKIRVSYKFYEGQNPRDPDNLLFAMKFVHDAFVAVGIVEDDDIWHVALGGFEFIPGAEFKVVVSWEVVE